MSPYRKGGYRPNTGPFPDDDQRRQEQVSGGLGLEMTAADRRREQVPGGPGLETTAPAAGREALLERVLAAVASLRRSDDGGDSGERPGPGGGGPARGGCATRTSARTSPA